MFDGFLVSDNSGGGKDALLYLSARLQHSYINYLI
jgi:hypothetical protein